MHMKQRLEDFIKQHRGAFDDKEPSKGAWKGIDKQLSGRRVWWNSVGVWRAAAVFFLAVSVYLFISSRGSETAANDVAMNEFQDVEKFYVQQIAEKVHLIDQFQRNEGLNGFTQDFQQLDAMYMVLKEEMEVRPSKKVKDALVLNLLVRIDLLNQQLYKLENEREEPAAASS